MTPPFLAGQAAQRDGQPITANPHTKPAKTPSGDDYPGPWANWRDGWTYQRNITKHGKKG